MADKQSQSMMAKLAGAGAALAAAWVVQKVIDKAWVAASGHKPPAPESQDDDINFREVALAAVVTGALVALSRVLATRGTARLAARIDGGPKA
jgi:hypothetical protein